MSVSTSTDGRFLPQEILRRLKFNKDGLVAAIAQEVGTGDVLMQAWMNEEALALTLQSKKGTYFSRSRQSLWVKGDTSGNRQQVKSVKIDCDGDTILLQVEQTGPACHLGNHTCFDDGEILDIN